MRQLHARIAKLEQAVGGPIPEDQKDPMLIDFLSKFGIPTEQCPFGTSASEYIGEVLRLLSGRVPGVAKPAG